MAAFFTIAIMMKQTKCPLTEEWISKNVQYTYIGTLFSLKKKENSDTCNNVDEH